MKTAQQLKDATFDSFEGMMSHQRHVSINKDKLNTLIKLLKKEAKQQAFKPYGWTEYVSAAAGQGTPVNVARLVFEMALISGQQAGFIDADAYNTPRKWEIEGSGAKAMVQKMDALRESVGVLGIDFTYSEAVFQKIAKILGDDIPFKTERLALMQEFAQASAYGSLEQVVLRHYDAPNNKIVMDVAFLQEVAALFPKNFTEDPFGKKACLTLLLSAANLKARGVKVDIDIWAASDYRLPQTLVALGVLEISDELRTDLENQTLLHQDDMKVWGLRVASILAAERICEKTNLPIDHVDSILWSAPRNEALMRALGTQSKEQLPHMMVRTLRF